MNHRPSRHAFAFPIHTGPALVVYLALADDDLLGDPKAEVLVDLDGLGRRGFQPGRDVFCLCTLQEREHDGVDAAADSGNGCVPRQE